MSDPQITIADMCQRHQSLLVHQAGYKESDPWRALVIMAQVALFQGASCDPKIQAQSGGDIAYLGRIGCLACRKPDLFGLVVEAAKTREMWAIKALGEKWVASAAKP